MRYSSVVGVQYLNMKAFLFTLAAYTAVCAATTKRGLIYIPSADHPEDDALWIQPGSDLTWYYTYNDRPNPSYNQLDFVPMMWGMGSDPDDKSFYNSIVNQVNSGVSIRNVLAFNEPDMISDWGGSDIEPARAARGYIANFIPLRQRGLRIGMPAVSGAGWGIDWLRQFDGNCTELMGTKCEYDFLPVHWYDNLDGMKAHIDEAVGQ